MACGGRREGQRGSGEDNRGGEDSRTSLGGRVVAGEKSREDQMRTTVEDEQRVTRLGGHVVVGVRGNRGDW